MRLKNAIVFLLIVLLAAVLRLYNLGQNPPALDWDEASLGWNAYSILKTGSDEYGKPLPVSIRSFNDYKPPGYVYAAVPSIAIFGLNEFSVRFPSAFAGILTVIITFFLVKKMSGNLLLGYLVTWLLAVSPWSIQFSRGAFEANLALFFFVFGVYLLLKLPILSILPFILSIYSYHSSKIVVPSFLFSHFLINFRSILKRKLYFISYILVFSLLLYPLVRNTIHTGSLAARYQTVAAKLDPIVIGANYLRHFDLNFLFVTGDSQPRHHAPDVGLLYLAELPLIFAGGYFLFKNKPKFLLLLIIWVLSAPVAASLANDSPHAIRSLLFLPTFQIITAYGLFHLRRKFLYIFGFLLILNTFYYFHQYFVHLPIETAPSWQYGYKQVVKKVLAVENQYPRIYITNFYDQPYIYFLFYGRIDPIIKNNGYFYANFDKYEFSLNTIDPKGLYIFAPKDSPPTGYSLKTLDTINFPDGKTAFTIGRIEKS